VRKLIALLCLVFCLSCGPALGSPRYARTARQLAHMNHATVALVAEFDGKDRSYCTGSFIAHDTVITAGHCVFLDDIRVVTYAEYLEDGEKYHTNSGQWFTVERVGSDKDLALLKLAEGEVLPYHTVLSLATQPPVQGENVYMVAHPRGYSWTLTAGVVSYMVRNDEGAFDYYSLYVQHVTQGAPGSSGAPLLNQENQLVGVHSWGHGNAYLSFSVHLDVVKEFLNE